MLGAVEAKGGPPRALRLKQRMDRLGMGNREMARVSGVSRNTVASARAGKAQSATYGKLERALETIETETGADIPDEAVAVIELPDGTTVTFRGVSAEEAARFAAEFLATHNQDASP